MHRLAPGGHQSLTQRLIRGPEGDGVEGRTIPSLRPDPQMAGAHLGNLDEAMGRESKDWFRVSRSEGARSVDLLDQFRARAGSGEGRIDEERLVRPGEIDGGGQGFFEECPEIAQPVTFDGDTRRHGMAAALDQ